MALIEAVNAREILDSRGNPTVEVEVLLDDGIVQRAAVPSGASTGAFEAYELRDGDKSRYSGKGVLKAVAAVVDELGPAIEGVEASEQRIIDEILIETDGTENKSRTGANAILGVSRSPSPRAADSADLPLFRYLGGPQRALAARAAVQRHQRWRARRQRHRLPGVLPRAHRRRHLHSESLRWGTEVYHVLKGELKSAGYKHRPRRRGRVRPRSASNREGLDFLIRAIEKAGFTPGQDIAVGLDVAATEFFKDGVYTVEGKEWSVDTLVDYFADLVANFPIVTIEDALAEDDWDGWKKLTDAIGSKVQLVGDDLFVTNPQRLQKGIDLGIANSLLVKVNQIGTLSETLDAINLATRSGYTSMLSHRSGETEDTTIADLAVAVNAGQIKTGAPARSERVAKYNQLLRIEEDLGDAAVFAGRSAFPRFKG